MRYAKKTIAPATAANLVSLLKISKPDTRGTEEVILQAPAANSNNVYYGTNAEQPGFVIPGGLVSLEVDNLKNVYVKGDGLDEVIILVLR